MKSELRKMQEEVLANKVRHGFNTENVEQEFCYLYGEVGEAYTAYYKQSEELPGELADVAIFLLGLSEILGIDLYEEIKKKMKINAERSYHFNSNGKPVKNDWYTQSKFKVSSREETFYYWHIINRK